MLRPILIAAFALTACKGPAGVEPLGRTFIEHVAAGRYAEAASMYDATMARNLPVPALRSVWEGAVLSHGPFVAQGKTREERVLRATRVVVEVEMARDYLDVAVVFDVRRKVAGLWLRPSERAKELEPVELPAGIQARELTVGLPEWQLGATLTHPAEEGPWPTVVMVHGSGPHDRDESIGPNAPFQDLAWGLARRGIASLRYEKRTKAHAARFEGEASHRITIEQETVDDAVAIVTALVRAPPAEVDPGRVWVLGHSLGGTWAPRIAERVRATGAHVAGLVILAGATRPLQQLVVEQSAYLAEREGLTDAERELLVEVRAAAARIAQGDLAGSKGQPLPLGLPPSYWRSLETYDLATTVRTLHLPILVLQGERDYQVTLEDYAGWQTALGESSEARLQTFPTLNHLFIAGEGPPGPEQYAREGQVADEVIDAIAQFVLPPSVP